ncbi:DUF6221 family protein [Streptomyces roseoviridis]|uniref:DUF6221 family protein n=1 Tax=Streptomyces roseoviridis TaxID=67361 RepID=A0ABV5R0J0_9ACTN
MGSSPIRLDEVWAFCSARLDDDVRIARSVGFEHIEVVDYLWESKHLLLQGDSGSKSTGELDAALAEHVARHDPARVLAEVAWKRDQLAEHEPSLQAAERDGELTPMVVCAIDGDDCAFTMGLAALYDRHPDYQEEWRL